MINIFIWETDFGCMSMIFIKPKKKSFMFHIQKQRK